MSDRGDEQTEGQGHGVDGINEAEAHGQASGHEKGHGLHLRHTEEEERGRDAGIGTGGCSDKGKTTIRLTHLCVSQGEEGGTGAWGMSSNCWLKAAEEFRLRVRY